MIQIENKPTVESNGITKTASFGIKESGISHIFHILRNQLYSDKETAVLREYATNAADAHIEAGIPDKPIQISLPSRFNLELKIRANSSPYMRRSTASRSGHGIWGQTPSGAACTASARGGR